MFSIHFLLPFPPPRRAGFPSCLVWLLRTILPAPCWWPPPGRQQQGQGLCIAGHANSWSALFKGQEQDCRLPENRVEAQNGAVLNSRVSCLTLACNKRSSGACTTDTCFSALLPPSMTSLSHTCAHTHIPLRH